MSDQRVVILGGGSTGLTTAMSLAEAGYPVTVIERLPWVGGIAKSFDHGPYKLDLGPHRFTPHNQKVFDIVNELVGGNLRVVKYQAQIWLANRFVDYPFKLQDLVTRIPPPLAAKLMISMMASSFSNKSGAKNYEEWIRQHFGSTVLELIFRPLIGKVWGTPLGNLSARFASQRIAISSLWEIAREVLTGHRDARYRTPFYPDNGFLYPPAGFGLITDGMADRIKKAGGRIEVGATLRQIEISEGWVNKVVFEKDGQTFSEAPSFVMSTIPIQFFFPLITPAAPSSVMETLPKLKTRRLTILYLVLKMDRFSKNTSIYFPSDEFPYGRVWEQKNHSLDMVNVPGRTVLGIEIPCWEGDPLATESDEYIFERAVAPLVSHDILKRDLVEEYFTVRMGNVYPVWDVDFEKNLEVILAYEKSVENLIFNGRPGLFFYNNIHHSIEMGLFAADHIRSGLPKEKKWNMDAVSFRDYRLVE